MTTKRGRPKGSKTKNIVLKNPQALLDSYHLWLTGASQSEIVKQVPVSLRTLTRWVAHFRTLPNYEVLLDRPDFSYHLMELYEIPWQAYEKVIQLMAILYEPSWTPRMAKWAWRMLQVDNPSHGSHEDGTYDDEGIDRYYFISRFVEAEQKNLIGLGFKDEMEEISEELQSAMLGSNEWST